MSLRKFISTASTSRLLLTICLLIGAGGGLMVGLIALIRASDYFAIGFILCVVIWVTTPTRPRSQKRSDPLNDLKNRPS